MLDIQFKLSPKNFGALTSLKKNRIPKHLTLIQSQGYWIKMVIFLIRKQLLKNVLNFSFICDIYPGRGQLLVLYFSYHQMLQSLTIDKSVFVWVTLILNTIFSQLMSMSAARQISAFVNMQGQYSFCILIYHRLFFTVLFVITHSQYLYSKTGLLKNLFKRL